MSRRALITGINGMDGSHLADLLLSKGYQVWGVERRSSTKNRTNTKHLEGKITFINGDMTDQNSLVRCLKESDPDNKIIIFVGGIIPEQDYQFLYDQNVSAIFGPGSNIIECAEQVIDLISKNSNKK